jgi:hypothetical protein
MRLAPKRLGGYLHVLVAVLLIQAVTGLLLVTALSGDWRATWPLFAALGAAVGALGAFWVSSLGLADRHAALAELGERHARERESLAERLARERETLAEKLAREREELRVKAERRRAEDLRAQERLAAAAKQGGALGPTMRAGLVAGGLAGAGVALILAQFVTLGLLTVAGVGGAAAGYWLRRRQERLFAPRPLETPPLIEARPEPVAQKRPRLAGRATQDGG